MSAFATARAKTKAWLTTYLANDDPYAAIANTGAFIVWSNQPFYPLYVAWVVGWNDAWPSLVTWLSTPFFFAVPLLARKNTLAGRSLFVVAGLLNSLLSLKAFGVASGIGWFFLPCLVIALMFFRRDEWPASLSLAFVTCLFWLGAGSLGAPFQAYTDAQSHGLTTLNVYSVVALTFYLVIAPLRVRLAATQVQRP